MGLNEKINTNKTKLLLVENELKKLQTFDSIYFRGKNHFEKDCIQNYLVFQPMYKYFKMVAGFGSGNYIYFWKSKGLPHENNTAPTTTNYSLNPQLIYLGTKPRLEFNRSCLKQDKMTYDHGNVANISIVFDISKNYD